MRRSRLLLVLATTLLVTSPVAAQSKIGCSRVAADQYQALADLTRAYIKALGPNLAPGNYPAEMREDVDTFSQERIGLYRDLEKFVQTTEDFSIALRLCDRQ